MRPYCEFDTECHPNYWLIKFYLPMGMMRSFTISSHKPAFTPQEMWDIGRIVATYTLVGFNSQNYDIPMCKLAFAGADPGMLKHANDAIIVGGVKHWQFAEHFPMALRYIECLDHIDIMEVVPGVRIGLKTYMARMHSPTIQELPYPPDAALNPLQMMETDQYCGNDLRGTRQLREIVKSRLALRETLTARLEQEMAERGLTHMRVDLRSKSDAQMSEVIIAAKLGYRPEVPYIPSGYRFKLRPAPWLQFVTPQFQAVFDLCKSVEFFWSRNDDGEEYIGADGKTVKTGVNMPIELKNVRPTMGSSTYKFGIGGLHSMEKCQTIYADDETDIEDDDVGSFYPSIAILMQLFGPEIMAVYREIYDTRMGGKPKIAKLEKLIRECVDTAKLASLIAEKEDTETIVSGFKIVLNGGYGKLWSKYSFLLDPEAGVAITINGQLSLLMLIERLELGGIRVISANTDGIVTLVPKALRWYKEQVMDWWRKATGLTTDRTVYKSIHSRDVNNYVAVKPNGDVKRKGAYCESGVLASMQGVHPARDICKTAAVQFLADGTPVGHTIRQCRDITQFILAKSVKGGGEWRGTYLGKTVRWYTSTDGSPITYVSNGNKVGGSDGARPIQTLPESFPNDIDYAAYDAYATELLQKAGVKI